MPYGTPNHAHLAKLITLNYKTANFVMSSISFILHVLQNVDYIHLVFPNYLQYVTVSYSNYANSICKQLLISGSSIIFSRLALPVDVHNLTYPDTASWHSLEETRFNSNSTRPDWNNLNDAGYFIGWIL